MMLLISDYYRTLRSRSKRALRPRFDEMHSAREASSRFNAIRRYYQAASTYLRIAPSNYRIGFTTVDAWGDLLSPIEQELASFAQSAGCALYPQYPIRAYFADFANPKERVVIECDGAAFHTDRARDMSRQRVIEKEGWVVYRIKGRDCFIADSPYKEEEQPEDKAKPPIHQLFDVLRNKHLGMF